MIKLPRMHNPISLAFEGYEMSTVGKLTIGALFAQAAASAVNNNSEQEQERVWIRNNERVARDAAILYANSFQSAEWSRNLWPTWSNQERRDWIVKGMNKTANSKGNRTDPLIPFLYGPGRAFDELFPI